MLGKKKRDLRHVTIQQHSKVTRTQNGNDIYIKLCIHLFICGLRLSTAREIETVLDIVQYSIVAKYMHYVYDHTNTPDIKYINKLHAENNLL